MVSEDLFDNFTYIDGLCTAAILLGSMIAAGGGLGGGGVFVPLYILILEFSTKKAAALSQATIFGGSIVNMAINFREYHPYRKHRPVTDFPTILIFGPMLLVGTVIGVLLNVVFPDGVILVLLTIVLVYCTVRTTRKGVRMWKSESRTREIEAHAQRLHEIYPTAQEDEPLLSAGVTVIESDDESIGARTEQEQEQEEKSAKGEPEVDQSWVDIAFASGLNSTNTSRERMQKLRPYIERESAVLKPCLIMFIVWVVICVTSLTKSEEITGIVTCSTGYWLIEFCSFPIMIVISGYFAHQAVQQFAAKTQLGWIPYRQLQMSGGAPDYDDDGSLSRNVTGTLDNRAYHVTGDIEWDLKKGVYYPMIATLAGLLGGLLGIGGGMIVSPLLMELGVIPRVAAATSALAVMITSSSATLQFALLGYLQVGFMFWFMAVGVVGTFIGQTAVNYGIRKYGRVSLIVFAVSAIMGGAVLLMGIDGVMELVQGTIGWAFHSPC